MRSSKTLFVAAGAAAALLLTGCSEINTDPDEVGITYNGGSFSSTQFQECVKPGTHNYDGPGDKHYKLPAGQRTLRWGDTNTGAEFPVIQVSSAAPEGQPMTVGGIVTFHSAFSTPEGGLDCDKLQEFMQRIGFKYRDDDDNVDWDAILRDYLQIPAEKAIKEATQQFNWADLYFGVGDTRQRWQDTVNQKFPAYAKGISGQDYFVIESTTLDAPSIPSDLYNALGQRQTNVQLNAAQTELNAKVLTEAEGLQPLIDRLGPAGAVLYTAIKDGRVQIIETQGGQIAIAPPAPR